MMAISRARRNFRRFLYVLLVFSMLFMGTAAYYRTSFQRTKEIAPLLFKIDVVQFQARAFFSNDDEKFKIALKLHDYGIFSPTYSNAGIAMLEDMVQDGYAPAQMIKANYLINTPSENARTEAIELYTLAAAQNHAPAIEAISRLGLAQSAPKP